MPVEFRFYRWLDTVSFAVDVRYPRLCGGCIVPRSEKKECMLFVRE